MTRLGLILAALCPTVVYGFSNTVPVIGWASHGSSALDRYEAGTAQPYAHSILDGIVAHESICEHDAIILVDQPGLHASDLRNLAPSSPLANKIITSPSSRQFPYARRSDHVDLSAVANVLQTRCGSRIASFAPVHGDVPLEAGVKHVIIVDMPSLESIEFDRPSNVDETGRLLTGHVDKIGSTHPNHIVVVISSSSPSIVGRSSESLESLLSRDGTPAEDGGILKRYQLLTPGLIVTLGIVLFVVVPIVMLGINALASIQSSVRLDAPKSFSAQEKKNQ